MHFTCACVSPLLHHICAAPWCQFAYSSWNTKLIQVLSFLQLHSGCHRWHTHCLHCNCRRPWCNKEPQGCAHTELPCGMFLWPSFHIHYVRLGGFCGGLQNFQRCTRLWFLHPKGEILPCGRWLCLIWGAASPLSRYTVPSVWMGSCWSCVRCLSFIYFLSYDNLSSLCNPKELFNLCHASARNVVERIFGILKRRFRILCIPPEYGMGV